jgi:hypothetical protein
MGKTWEEELPGLFPHSADAGKCGRLNAEARIHPGPRFTQGK